MIVIINIRRRRRDYGRDMVNQTHDLQIYSLKLMCTHTHIHTKLYSHPHAYTHMQTFSYMQTCTHI
jgi:hypothetical protein